MTVADPSGCCVSHMMISNSYRLRKHALGWVKEIRTNFQIISWSERPEGIIRVPPLLSGGLILS